MPEVRKIMEKDTNGIDRQIFPETVPEAIIGLNDLMAGESNVLSVNGKIGVVVITKEDLGLENAITELPFASEESDGIITAEMYLKILNSGGGDYILPIATDSKLGGIKIGELLSIDATGKLSATKQTDFNFTEALKNKLEGLKNYDLPTASNDLKGGVKIGRGLTMEADVLTADIQMNYTAGANISISNTGVISATGSGTGGGVSQEYVDQKATDTYQAAQAYTDSKIPSFSFEKVGEVLE